MGTILAVDAPYELRRLDRKFDSDIWRGFLVLRLVFCAAALLVLVVALFAGSLVGAVVMLAFLAAVAGPIWSLHYVLRKGKHWRVPVRHGVSLIKQAHSLYWRLTPSSQPYALPLIRTMYRISAVDVLSDSGARQVRADINQRLHALDRLLAAEDQVTIATAGAIVTDKDDLTTVYAYQEALGQVAELVRRDL